MRHLTTTTLLVCLFIVCSPSTKAQNTSPWIDVSPGDDFFHVLMPTQPSARNEITRYGEIDARGKRYNSFAEGAWYSFWSLVDTNYRRTGDVDGYLDESAELIWEGLLKSARDTLPEDQRLRARMTYVKELPAKPLPGREYSISIGELAGTTQFYTAESRIYVLLAMNSPGGAWAREKFFESFTISPSLPRPNTVYGDPRVANNKTINTDTGDANRVFSGRDVTEKARVLEKREPTYTGSARKFGVQGTIVLRAVFSKDGEVTSIQVVRRLPHGLTQQAINAARGIRFTPATKDGQPVSMYMQLEYNFNLF